VVVSYVQSTAFLDASGIIELPRNRVDLMRRCESVMPDFFIGIGGGALLQKKDNKTLQDAVQLLDDLILPPNDEDDGSGDHGILGGLTMPNPFATILTSKATTDMVDNDTNATRTFGRFVGSDLALSIKIELCQLASRHTLRNDNIQQGQLLRETSGGASPFRLNQFGFFVVSDLASSIKLEQCHPALDHTLRDGNVQQGHNRLDILLARWGFGDHVRTSRIHSAGGRDMFLYHHGWTFVAVVALGGGGRSCCFCETVTIRKSREVKIKATDVAKSRIVLITTMIATNNKIISKRRARPCPRRNKNVSRKSV
jgi:hypothetical protein